MRPRQTSRQWFIVDAGARDMPRLPRGAGVLVIDGRASTHLSRITRLRRQPLLEERSGAAARVHNSRELRQALLRRTPVILLSPIYPTTSHPDWAPIPRMRAAALARLGGRRLFALGGLDAKRFKHVERLGFQGWAGIRAWTRGTKGPSRE